MAIIQALSIARSGLAAASDALSITGNNIANVNTVGYKGSRSQFADLLQASTGGSVQTGLGVLLQNVTPDFQQGSIENTGRSTDLAIQGRGFFVVGNGEGGDFLYTRAGDFQLDAEARLVTKDGMLVQGFPIDDSGAVRGGVDDISFQDVSSKGTATSRVEMRNNLDSEAPELGGFDATDFGSANRTSNFATTLKVYDSLGSDHDVSVYFSKTAPGSWEVNVAVDAGEVGNTPGDLELLGTFSLTFDTEGAYTANAEETITGVSFVGASTQDIVFDMGTPSVTLGDELGRDAIVQNAASFTVAGAPNGNGAGRVEGISIREGGIVTGIFDNGEARDLFVVAVQDFNAPEKLTALGNGLFRSTPEAGASSPSEADGRVIGAAIESSNVDLAQEFIDLITFQRQFQANSRVITTGDNLVQDLINIVR